MIVHDFSLTAKQVRIDTYNLRLMLVLVIPQFETGCNSRLHIVPNVTKIVCR